MMICCKARNWVIGACRAREALEHFFKPCLKGLEVLEVIVQRVEQALHRMTTSLESIPGINFLLTFTSIKNQIPSTLRFS